MFGEKPVDNECLSECEKATGKFEECYRYCQENREFKLPEDPMELNNFGMEWDVHPVCLLCYYSCKQAYHFWSFQMPPDMFCDRFKERDIENE